MTTQRHVTLGTAEWAATIDGDAVTIAGVDAPFAVSNAPGDRVTAAHDGQEVSAATATSGDAVWITLDGHVFEFRVTTNAKRARAGAASSGLDTLMPPMSATVVRILVKPGDRVEAGDTLVVLEAMKMELPIRAPRASTIGAVHCHEGDLVTPEQSLIDLAPVPR